MKIIIDEERKKKTIFFKSSTFRYIMTAQPLIADYEFINYLIGAFQQNKEFKEKQHSSTEDDEKELNRKKAKSYFWQLVLLCSTNKCEYIFFEDKYRNTERIWIRESILQQYKIFHQYYKKRKKKRKAESVKEILQTRKAKKK